MPLAPGDRLGPYEVQSALGSGGMGEVYLARDSRLNRNVAVKVLRGGLDAGAEARFRREAEVVASLNHPNIVALFEIGKQGEVEFTVSELVDGVSLRQRLAGGALPVRQCVDITTQIADGLACAHTAGVVHRDLKPENVMLTRDGRVKVLDFGLARQSSAPTFGSGSSGETMAVPVTTYQTQVGVVLGTAAYMSPEQARGEEADYRSDQFSLGLMLYEMLTGVQPFARPSAVETMAAIVRDEPPPLPDGLRAPAPLIWILERLLEKNREQRFDSTRDLYQQLRAIDTHWSAANSSSRIEPAKVEVPKTVSARGVSGWLVAVAILVGLAVGALMLGMLRPAGVNLGTYRYLPFAMNTTSAAFWARDGKAVLYSARVKDLSQVFLAEQNGPPRQLTQMDDDSWPLGFDDDDDHVLFLHRNSGDPLYSVYRVSRSGGPPQHVLDLPPAAKSVQLSPDGKTLAMLAPANNASFGIVYSSPIGSPLKTYAPPEIASQLADIFNTPQLAFTPDGQQLLLVVDVAGGRELSWLVPWPAGKATPRQIDLRIARAQFTPSITWMPDNKRILYSVTPDESQTPNIYVGKPGGPYHQLTSSTDSYVEPAISPDGKTLSFVVVDSDLNIVGLSVSDGTQQDVISTVRDEVMPAWAMHADVMAYVTNRAGPPEIWTHSTRGEDRRVATLKDMPEPESFFMNPVPSPDGSRIAFVAAGAGGSPKIWLVSAMGGTPVRATNSNGKGSEFVPFWSPDGSRIVYSRLDAGKRTLNIVGSDGTETPAAVLTVPYLAIPTWMPDGQHIVYCMDNDVLSIAPDGSGKQTLASKVITSSVAASGDGSALYGIRMDGTAPVLFSLDAKTHAMRDIKRLTAEMQPASNLTPGTLVTLSPDGKLLTFATRTARNSIWMLTGFSQ